MRTLSMTLLVMTPAFVSFTAATEKEKQFVSTKDELKIVDLTNAERKKGDKAVLVINPKLCKIARAHSENMARQEKLDHKLDNKTVFNRLNEAKYRYRFAAENVAFGDPRIPIEKVMKMWMESEGHRKNLLNGEVREIGVGIARAANGDLYYTQVFAKPAD